MMVSDAVLLALIAAFPASLAAATAMIIALRAHEKIDKKENYDEGARAGREKRQRKTDRTEEPE